MDEWMPLRLFTLGKEFKTLRTVDVASTSEARAVVEEHLKGSGYTNLRTKDDDDGSLRFIADPPTGRKGRNVASMDY